MKILSILLILVSTLWLFFVPCQAQSLADLARKEREKREGQKSPSKVFTNEDVNYGSSRSSAAPAEEVSEPEGSKPIRSKAEVPVSNEDDERAWSKRFIEAKARLQQAKNQSQILQAKLNELNLNLLRANPQGQSEVYDREHLYLPLIAQTREQIEKNKSDIAAAEQALEELKEELRKGGRPVSWENSQLSLQADDKARKPDAPKVKDQRYWQEQLSIIDKRYAAQIDPLLEERFQLVNRRPVKEGESTTTIGTLGLGVPPRVIDIDVQIKDLTQKRDQEKAALVEQAIREGALPGWFR